MSMQIAELWRYPVKSMGGESLQEVELRDDGFVGDRILQVRNRHEKVITARRRPKLLGHRATLGPDGEPLVDGRPWTDPSVAADIRIAAGEDAHLARSDENSRFDVLPLLVATDGAIEAFGHDRRRLRPNIVVAGVSGTEERTWERRTIRAGPVIIGVHTLRERCVMTTFDPDTLVQDKNVFYEIQQRFDGTLALNCHVLQRGVLRVGDVVELLD